ncbi:MAG TPA: hypothetical protein VNA22_04230, partial [Pyrinomonadaceae bacterium]|nr:hypothetical protein [Pyrinomonadaceae bacterium]
KATREVADTTTPEIAPRRVTRNTNTSTSPDGNSYTITQEIAPVVTPKGIPAGQGRNANVGGTNISVQQVLEMLSIKAEQSPGGWLVRSTIESGIAGRSGIQPNDVIEAIDDKKIPSGGQLSARFEMKTLTVRRAGKLIKIGLKN